MTTIKRAIQKLNGSAIIQTYLCKIVSVDKDKCECEPITGGANFLDVRLRSVLDDKKDGILITPKVGSKVIVALIENNEASAFVVQFSEIEKIEVKNAGGMTFDLLKDVLKLNGDGKGGLVQIQELKDNLDALKSYVEAMNTALPIAFQAILASSSANGQLGATSYTGSMAGKIILFKDMENKKVKHG